jgi:hypothetical protein
MGFAFPQTDGSLKLDLTDEWYDKFDDIFETLTENNAVNEADMQIYNRNIVVEDNL